MYCTFPIESHSKEYHIHSHTQFYGFSSEKKVANNLKCQQHKTIQLIVATTHSPVEMMSRPEKFFFLFSPMTKQLEMKLNHSHFAAKSPQTFKRNQSKLKSVFLFGLRSVWMALNYIVKINKQPND